MIWKEKSVFIDLDFLRWPGRVLGFGSRGVSYFRRDRKSENNHFEKNFEKLQKF